MLQPLLELYKLLDANSSKFTEAGLMPISYIDVYRSQPVNPEMYEYFSLPAIFVDYYMQGQGFNKPRLVTITIHVVVDELPDASTISEQKTTGLNRFLYLLLIQQILDGKNLGKTTALKFLSENIVDIPVANYHIQSYQFEAYISDMIGNIQQIFGEFERLYIYKSLLKNT